MILIADSGSTKTDWILTDGARCDEFVTEGLNPALMPDGELTDKLSKAIGQIDTAGLRSVVYYGAGCLPERCGAVSGILSEVTGCSDAEAHSDMLGAARAVCGHSRGIVAILGTGSNSCLFDGEKITDSVPPLGYVLGDEGSGARIGIAFINALYKRRLPLDIAGQFAEATGLDRAIVTDKVYRQPATNAFLASLVPFVSERTRSCPELRQIVVDEFGLFFDRNIVGNYPSDLAVHFVGSIASVFESELREAASQRDIRIGRLLPRPLPALVRYHLAERAERARK